VRAHIKKLYIYVLIYLHKFRPRHKHKHKEIVYVYKLIYLRRFGPQNKKNPDFVLRKLSFSDRCKHIAEPYRIVCEEFLSFISRYLQSNNKFDFSN